MFLVYGVCRVAALEIFDPHTRCQVAIVGVSKGSQLCMSTNRPENASLTFERGFLWCYALLILNHLKLQTAVKSHHITGMYAHTSGYFFCKYLRCFVILMESQYLLLPQRSIQANATVRQNISPLRVFQIPSHIVYVFSPPLTNMFHSQR